MTNPSGEDPALEADIAALRAHLNTSRPSRKAQAARTRAINGHPDLINARVAFHTVLASCFVDTDKVVHKLEKMIDAGKSAEEIAYTLMVNPASFTRAGGWHGEGLSIQNARAHRPDEAATLPLIENLEGALLTARALANGAAGE